ncbi:MAG: alpha-mannosidase [Clostridia bacterium]|nr:alpha-mannosidase [Clostridia bacterium]
MTFYDKLDRLRHSRYGYWSDRIVAELGYAVNTNEVNGHRFDREINEAADILLAAVDAQSVITKRQALEAESKIAVMSELCKKNTVHMIAHAHIDMNWMWGYNETASVVVDTARTMLDLMKEYPQFKFSQSQASIYQVLADFAPDVLREVKRRVHEGRWEVTASSWVENDKNMPNGESMARHILYTKRYLSKLLDIPEESMELDFEPDTFGHNVMLPEILSAGGVKYYYHTRAYEGVHPVVWKGRNGASVLVYRDPSTTGYNGSVHPEYVNRVPLFCSQYKVNCMMELYGVGDHGGGPTRRDIERLMDMQKWPVMANIKFSTMHAYFHELEKFRDVLPVVEGEQNYIFTGCYTSESRIKTANRIAETRSQESEALCAAAGALGAPSQVGSFEQSWHNILFNHFHDILTGSGIIETREYAMGMFQRSMTAVNINANRAMRYLASKVDTSSIQTEKDLNSISEGGGVGFRVGPNNFYTMPRAERGMGRKRIIHLFNTTQYDYDGITEISVFDWPVESHRALFSDAEGKETGCKCINGGSHYWGHDVKEFAVHVKVPAFGYATYVLSERSITSVPTTMENHDRRDDYSDEDIVMANGKIRAVFDHATMELKSLVDLESGREMLRERAGFFRLIEENKIHGMSAWRVGDRMRVTNLNRASNVVVSQINLGGVKQWVTYTLKFGERSKMTCSVVLGENARVLDYQTSIDFHEITNDEMTPQVNFCLPFGYEANRFRYDIPFSTIDRPAIAHDVPANSFVAPVPVEEGAPALMLTTDTRYGYRAWDGAVSVDLIRGSNAPDPYPEYGVHVIRIGVGVASDCGQDHLFAINAAFQHGVMMCSAQTARAKKDATLPLCGRLFEVKGNVQVHAVKSPEEGEGLIIRLADTDGQGGAFALNFHVPVAEACYVDLTEHETKEKGKLTVKGNAVSGKMEGYAIRTIRVALK